MLLGINGVPSRLISTSGAVRDAVAGSVAEVGNGIALRLAGTGNSQPDTAANDKPVANSMNLTPVFPHVQHQPIPITFVGNLFVRARAAPRPRFKARSRNTRPDKLRGLHLPFLDIFCPA